MIIRINLLDRQGRLQEALYLAEAAGQIERHIIEVGDYSSAKLDILVEAGRLTAVMRALNKNFHYATGDLLRMLAPTKDKYPDWGIQKCQNLAEAIMNAGRSGEYDTAVNWLRRAKEIYLHHQRQAEWRSYLDSLLAQHGRKYKLVPMLQAIR